jgi:hypothetical protein
MGWDVMIVYKKEGVSACNPLCVGEIPKSMPWHSRLCSLA